MRVNALSVAAAAAAVFSNTVDAEPKHHHPKAKNFIYVVPDGFVLFPLVQKASVADARVTAMVLLPRLWHATTTALSTARAPLRGRTLRKLVSIKW